MNEKEAVEISYVLAGKRKAVLLALDKDQTPTQISKVVDVSVNNLWSKLKDLQDHGMAKCLNPDARRFRIYSRTKKGDVIAEKVRKMDA